MAHALVHPVLTLSLPKGVVYSLAISPSGRLIAGSGGVMWSVLLGKDNSIKVWDSQSGQLLHHLTGHSNLVSAVAFSPNGSTLLSGSLDGTLKVWDTQTFQAQHTIDPSSPTPWKLDGKPLKTSLPKIDSIAIHPTQTWVAAGDLNEGVTLWDYRSHTKLCVMGGHQSGTPIAFSPDGRQLVTCDDHAGYNVFDVSTGQRNYPPKGKAVFGRRNGTQWITAAPNLRSIAFSPNGTLLAGGSQRGLIYFWDITSGTEQFKLKASAQKGDRSCITALHFSPDGKRLLSASFDQTIKLWDMQTQQCLCTFVGHTSEIYAIALSTDGRTLVSSDRGRNVLIWKSHLL